MNQLIGDLLMQLKRKEVFHLIYFTLVNVVHSLAARECVFMLFIIAFVYKQRHLADELGITIIFGI